MRLAGFEGDAQRLARSQQVLLSDHFVQRARAQLLGERRGGVRRFSRAGEEVSPQGRPPLWAG